MSNHSFTIPRDTLLPALSAAVKAVQRRSTIPILQNVLLEASADTLTVTGTDLDVEVTVPVACSAVDAFSTTLPAGNLHDAIRKLPEGCEVRISAEKDFCAVHAGRSRFRLPVLPASDYPRLSAIRPAHEFRLAAKLVERMIATLRFAVSTEETRFYLNGIYLHPSTGSGSTGEGGADELCAVATDGHRLASLSVPLPEGAAGMPGIIVPRMTIDVLKGLGGGPAGNHDAEIVIGVSETLIRFALPSPLGQGSGGSGGGVTLASKLIDGTYPDYRRVVPKGNANSFELDRAGLAAACDRVTTISGERGRAVKFAFAAGTATLSCVNPDSGSAEEEVPADCTAGEPVEIGFNGKYCMDMLAAAGGERIGAELGAPGDPALFRPLDGPEPRPLFVLMPMRV